MLRFSIMKPSFVFTDVRFFAIPATGFVHDFRQLRTIQAVLSVREERLIIDAVDTRVKMVYTRFKTLRDLVAM